ncbi:anti-sigma factor domain-containing protein [Cohnella suwonensis]|uniref:Anti-sigma-W factor RsiW n=1 Tax=Cohnella suwonensis TaxID=696072 RepID=A0ABW0LNX1_9BACL
MEIKETTPCDGLVDYMAGEGTDLERKRFEKHLVTCSACTEEATAWREVWDRLTDDVTMVEPPADLKDSVLRPLFDANEMIQEPVKQPRGFRGKRLIRAVSWTAVLISVFIAGWLMRGIQTPSSETEAIAQAPTNIETIFNLTAENGSGMFADNSRAWGLACLIRSENKEQLVVYIFGSPQTQGQEAYQVWLWKGDQRSSAGTFTVGSSGVGILTLPLTESIPDIEAVGVTLEPNSHSSEPKGPKMFGSDKQETTGTI